MKPQKVYWDASCFISFVSGDQSDEAPRASICEDILNHVRDEEDKIRLYTSVWTIAETIRPKSIITPPPLPDWAHLLGAKDKDGNTLYPKAIDKLKELWEYHAKSTAPTRILPEQQATKIRQMFDWKWIRLVQVTPAIAHRAVEIARMHNMRPGDAIHVATALDRACDIIHKWDKDFSRTDGLIPSKDPEWMSILPPNPGLFASDDPQESK
jgi:predicted nucleic acid-binding protein